MPDPLPPIILFPGDAVAGGFGVKYGYLVRIDGQPWAYPPDARSLTKEPGVAGALKLDPMRIVEETNSETGLQSYAYLSGPPAAR